MRRRATTVHRVLIPLRGRGINPNGAFHELGDKVGAAQKEAAPIEKRLKGEKDAI
jgi:hypothetical protein